MRMTTELELRHAIDQSARSTEGIWWWRLNVDEPRVCIEGRKWNYKTKATAMQAALNVARRFGLRIKSRSVIR